MELTEKRELLNEHSAKFYAAVKRGDELREKGEGNLSEAEETELTGVINDLNYFGPSIRGLAADIASYVPTGSVANEGHVFTGKEAEEAYKSIGKRFVELEDIKRQQTRQEERPGHVSMDVPVDELSQRALVTVAGLPANYLEPQRLAGIQRYPSPFLNMRDVLTVMQTNSDTIYYVQESAFTNNAAAVGEATAVTGSSGLKPESGFTLVQATAPVTTLAHWIPITKQTLWNAPELESYINTLLMEGLQYEEDDQILNGNGTAPNLRGLLNTSGIQELDAAYFAVNGVNGTGTDREVYNRIRRARTLIATVGRSRANWVALNPEDRERIDTFADAEGQYYGSGPFTNGDVANLWGMRVVENEGVTAGEAVVGDGRRAAIFDRMTARIETGWVNDDFIRNMIRLLAEKRLGLAVFRPSAFAVVDLAITVTP